MWAELSLSNSEPPTAEAFSFLTQDRLAGRHGVNTPPLPDVFCVAVRQQARVKAQMLKLPTPERVRELIAYDPISGVFTRATKTKGRYGEVGRRCGTIDRYGYLLICIDGQRISAGRVAWVLSHGRWPQWHIDHIDGDKLNNVISNLRDVPNEVNAQNKRKATSRSALGCLGVSKVRQKYVAVLSYQGKRYRFGRFDSVEEASKAYIEGKRRLHEGCTL